MVHLWHLLQVLWLSDNRISRLQGLAHLGRLRHLHLAHNEVRCVGDALAGLTCLQLLNLADNPICHFQVGATQCEGVEGCTANLQRVVMTQANAC